jgi:cation transport regulator
MPYALNSDLPASVRLHLPEHAQDIFRSAFIHAYQECKADPRQEEIANRVAWSAAKRKYEKSGEKWVPRAASKLNCSCRLLINLECFRFTPRTAPTLAAILTALAWITFRSREEKFEKRATTVDRALPPNAGFTFCIFTLW